MKGLLTNIWRWNPVVGGWVLVRDSYLENATRWLAVFRGDEPNSVFMVSKRRPVKAPKALTNAE